jgi:hypothetical protein
MKRNPRMAASSPPNTSVLAAIGVAFRQNWLPCVLLNAVAVSLVVSYYRWPALAGMWQSIGACKVQWSFVFSCVSTMFAAAVMPFFVQRAMGVVPSEGRWSKLVLRMVFWGYRGMEIDLFYRVQGWLFGNGNDAGTLAKKVAVDQFIMSPFWFVPTYVIALRWIERGGAWSRLRASLDRPFWTRTCLTVMVTNWLIWIPALALVYSLPAPLQFPLFSVVMCFFILVVTLLTRDPGIPVPEGTAG